MRALRALRHRWWVVVLVALLGAATAMAAAEFRNRNLQPEFEAIAPVTVLRLPEESDENFDLRVATVVSQARSAVAGRLGDPNLDVTEGEAGGVVHFVAIAPTSTDALAAATDLRREYLTSGTAGTAQEQLNPVLDALLDEIEVVESELAELRGQQQPDPIASAERAALESQYSSAIQEQATLEARLLDPNLEEEVRAESEDRLSALATLISRLESRLQEVPPTSTSIGDSRARMQIMVLERRLRDLEAQYVAAAVRQGEVGNDGLVGEPFVLDRSATQLSLVRAGVVGVLAGCLLASGAVIAVDRIRQPIRSPEDLPGSEVVELPSRRTYRTALDWYSLATGDRRRTGIQQLRSRVQDAERGKVVLIEGIDCSAQQIRLLAVDLAVSLAAANRRVLFLDTNFGDAPWKEPGIELVSLGELLTADHDSMADPAKIKRALTERPELIPNLLYVPAGHALEDTADLLATATIGEVIGEARNLTDVVVVAAPAAQEPGADSISRLAQTAILVTARQHTRRESATRAISRLEGIGVSVAAIGLVDGRDSRRAVQISAER